MTTDKELLAILDVWENMEESHRLEQLKFLLKDKEKEMLEKFEEMIENEDTEIPDDDGIPVQISSEAFKRELLRKLKGDKKQ